MSYNYQKIKNELQWRFAFKTTLAISISISILIVNFFHFRQLPFIAPISVTVIMLLYKNEAT